MPVARYFFIVGGVLLALLFVVDAYLPETPPVRTAGPDLAVARIHIRSNQKWPERIVYDTSLPTIVPVKSANTDADVRIPTSVKDIPVTAQAREAFAQLGPLEPKKAEPKPARKRKYAKRHTAPMFQLAQRPQFGWFGRSFW